MARGYRVKRSGDPAGFVRRTYECPDCNGRFEVFERRDEHPAFCLKCGARFDDEQEAVPGTHAIGGSAAAKAVDFTYDQLVLAGKARAELTGNPNLKITDMNDRVYEGETAAQTANTSADYKSFIRAADQVAGAIPNNPGLFKYGFIGGGGGPGTAHPRVGGMMPGPGGPNSFVGPGHVAMNAFQPAHQRNVEIAKAGGMRAKADMGRQ